MRRTDIFKALAALFVLVPSVASAQDIDPTVVVSRKYEGKLMEVSKPAIEMAIPDSVTTFALDIDYSVFEKPYKGAYEFNPYVLTMQPASAVQAPRQLYMKAGAGYTLYPTLDLVWTPSFKGPFSMDVYAMHRSYVGNYRSFTAPESYSDEVVIERWKEVGGAQKDWFGYDLQTRAGVDGRYDWNTVAADFDVAYYGLASKDLVKTRAYDALDVRFGVASKSDNADRFVYKAGAAYRFAEDKISSEAETFVGEHIFNAEGTFGQVFSTGHRALMDLGVDVVAYKGCPMESVSGHFYLVPHYMYVKDRWGVDAGLRIAKVFRPEVPVDIFQAKEQIVYPDIKAWFNVLPNAMRLYAAIGGGSKMNTYASLLEENHHMDPSFGFGGNGFMDVTVERVSTVLGVEGRIASSVSYDLKAGYVNYANALLDAVAVGTVPNVQGLQYLPGFGYDSYQKFFVSADWNWRSENIRFDGTLNYTHAWGFTADNGLFALSPFTGDASFEYCWGRRIYAGIDCEFATGRKGALRLASDNTLADAVIPGYADLGIYFEVAASRVLSVWARGGNLLNMTIQRNPVYAEKGINFTVGVCLNL